MVVFDSQVPAYRMYRATVTEAFVLCPQEPRTPCPLHSIAADHRTQVTPSVIGGGALA